MKQHLKKTGLVAILFVSIVIFTTCKKTEEHPAVQPVQPSQPIPISSTDFFSIYFVNGYSNMVPISKDDSTKDGNRIFHVNWNNNNAPTCTGQSSINLFIYFPYLQPTLSEGPYIIGSPSSTSTPGNPYIKYSDKYSCDMNGGTDNGVSISGKINVIKLNNGHFRIVFDSVKIIRNWTTSDFSDSDPLHEGYTNKSGTDTVKASGDLTY